MKENFLHRFYPESQFGGFSDIDGTIASTTANVDPEQIEQEA